MSNLDEWYQKAVAKGELLYDGKIPYPMYVIEQNYDYFHSMYQADGCLEPGELPKLNDDGKVFYLFLGQLPSSRPYGVSNMGAFMSLGEAKAWVETSLPYFWRWLSYDI